MWRLCYVFIPIRVYNIGEHFEIEVLMDICGVFDQRVIAEVTAFQAVRICKCTEYVQNLLLFEQIAHFDCFLKSCKSGVEGLV